jgi:hypothetical protein
MRNAGTTGQYVTGINGSGQLTFDTPAGGGGSYNIAISNISPNTPSGLAGVPTTSLAVGTLITFFLSGELQDWILTATTQPSTTGIQRPLDYHSSTNVKAWVRCR